MEILSTEPNSWAVEVCVWGVCLNFCLFVAFAWGKLSLISQALSLTEKHSCHTLTVKYYLLWEGIHWLVLRCGLACAYCELKYPCSTWKRRHKYSPTYEGCTTMADFDWRAWRYLMKHPIRITQPLSPPLESVCLCLDPLMVHTC